MISLSNPKAGAGARGRPSFRVCRRLLSLGMLLPGCWLLAIGTSRALIGTEYQMLLGNPSNATTDTNNHNHFLIQRTVQALDYSDNLGLAVWASWNLTAPDIGTNTRSSFTTDTTLPPNFYAVTQSDYTYSGYDRGHLCPSKDRTDTPENNELVFLMSNIMPQSPVNNQGPWLQFENYCRDLVESTNNYELLILCGPGGFSGARINTNGPVFIPDYTWKIAVVVPPGAGYATNRITATNRVIAIKIPNNDSATNAWTTYVTSAAQIQVDTGLTFFTTLPSAVAAALRSKVDGQTNPPPVIAAFTPANGASGTGVTINGTNFSLASSVTFNGAGAAFTVDSPTQITAIVPTNAGSGFISVTTPSGTAISESTFTVLNNGGAVYTGVLAGWDVSTLGSFGPSPYAATANASGLAVTGLTRGSGVMTNGTGAARAWGGVGFTNATVSGAVGANQFATFSITPSNGCTVSFAGISRFDYRRSGTGPANGMLQFRINSGEFTNITSLSYPSTGSGGASLEAIDLSGVAALQNVGANTSVTFRIVNYGGGPSGTWYVFDTQSSPAPDLAVHGTVTQLAATNPPAAPALTGPVFANNTFTITVTGTDGASYVLACATSLAEPVWVPVMTNTAPYQYTGTNSPTVPRRFYRAYSAP